MILYQDVVPDFLKYYVVKYVLSISASTFVNAGMGGGLTDLTAQNDAPCIVGIYLMFRLS